MVYHLGETLRDEDLVRPSLAAKSRRQIGHGAYCGVVPAALEADGAERRIALGDANTEA